MVATACSSGTTKPLVFTSPAAGYDVTYRVEFDSGAAKTFATERVFVQRPFNRRDELFTGQPRGRGPDGRRTSLTLHTFDRTLSQQETAPPLVLTTPPLVAVDDVRLDALLPDLLRLRYARVVGRHVVLGRRCEVVRTTVALGSTFLSGLTSARPPTRVDTCVDSSGLVLDERRYDRGRQTERRLAVAVDAQAPQPATSLFGVAAAPVAATEGGGFVRQLADDSRPPGRAFWRLLSPPAGFTHRGRYAVVPPQPRSDQPGAAYALVSGIVDVYVDGSDVITIDQGGTLGQGRPFAPAPNAPHVQTPIGDGEVLLSGNTAEVRVFVPPGRYVTVAGTVAVAFVTRIAQSLVPQPGGRLVFVHDHGT